MRLNLIVVRIGDSVQVNLQEVLPVVKILFEKLALKASVFTYMTQLI